MSGILSCKIVEGSFITSLFKGFLKGLLNEMQPYPAPNSVIVLDNAKVHKNPEICEMIEGWYVISQDVPIYHEAYLWTLTSGMKTVYLPPYSPDFNPIELAFLAIKAYVQCYGNIIWTAMQDKDDLDVYLFLYKATFHTTEEDIEGFYSHCGYIYVIM